MANSLIILHQIYLLMSKQGFPMTPLILGLSCEPDLTLHQISYPLNIFLLLFAWLVENCSLFPSLISWQIEKKKRAPKECNQCVPLHFCVWVHKCVRMCVSTRFLSLCFQGEVCMPLVTNSALILPDITPEMWLPCESSYWEQSEKNKYSKSCLQDPKVMWSAKEAEIFA